MAGGFATRAHLEIVYNNLLPSLIILIFIGILMGLVQKIYHPTRREMIIALFTGFYVSYIILTFAGTSFRGPGQSLVWPWDLPTSHH